MSKSSLRYEAQKDNTIAFGVKVEQPIKVISRNSSKIDTKKLRQVLMGAIETEKPKSTFEGLSKINKEK